MPFSSSLMDPDRIWLCMGEGNCARVVSRTLAKGLKMVVLMGGSLKFESPVSLAVADDQNAHTLDEARGNAGPGFKSLLVTASSKPKTKADIYLPHDTDAVTLSNAIEGLQAYRRYESAMGSGLEINAGAMNALDNCEFTIQTPAQAAHISSLLAAACPRSCEVAVGLYVLLASAIENGNLGFTANEKAKAMASGKWMGMIRVRMGEPDFKSRRVRVKYKRGGRIISITIQDDGPGIDAETAEMGNPARTGYRGKVVNLARTLGFTQINYLGVGNIVEASILLPRKIEEAMPVAAAG